MSDRRATAVNPGEHALADLARRVRALEAGANRGPGASYGLPFTLGDWEITVDDLGRLVATNLTDMTVAVIAGDTPTWVVNTGNSVNVAAASTVHFDLFNASGSGVLIKVRSVLIIPTLVAVVGVGLTWTIDRTSAVGTGGSTLTPRPLDTTNDALPAQVTARSKPTGGATSSYTMFNVNSSSEETTPYAGMASILNHLRSIHETLMQPVVLREGEGLRVTQTTSSNIGSTNIQAAFTVE